jgi:4-amino-4-deoxy-L-arabinose transferase-like glycosyltransferase
VRPATRIILASVLLLAAFSSLRDLTARGIVSWDEGVYYDEARFVCQGLRAATKMVATRVTHRQPPSMAELKAGFVGLPPRMGRPVNCLVNALALCALGIHPWVPALVASLAGLGCILLLFLLMRRVADEQVALTAAFLLTVSPYFFNYRRLGLPEALGALLVLWAVWLLTDKSPAAGRWRTALGLGLVCGLAFGVNTRTLMLLPTVLAWRLYLLRREQRATTLQLVGQGVVLAGGFAALLVVYQSPYWLIGRLVGPEGPLLETYFASLHRFTRTSLELGGLSGHSVYGAIVSFFRYYEGPTVLLFGVGVWAAWRQRNQSLGLLLSLMVFPLIQDYRLVPYARFQSWLLPIFAAVAAYGLGWVAQSVSQRSVQRIAVALVLVVVAAYAAYRDVPMMEARSAQAQALVWARQHGAAEIVDTNTSAALAYAPLYRLDQLAQLPASRLEALAVINRVCRTGHSLVIIETQQFMDEAIVMTAENYRQSAAAIIRQRCHPVWQAPHLRGMFPFLCFEHNRHFRQTLEVLRTYNHDAEQLAIFDARQARAALLASP